MSLAPGTKLGPYEIRAPIGAGGMGEVYKAHDSRLGRDVAVKVSAEKFSDRFEREARAVASLNHPHICQLYDIGPDYLVMELVDGKPLPCPLPLSEALPIAIQIAEALEHAHRRGIVHRDLKPANILMTKSGIKLLDFGLAKVGSAPGPTDVTATMGMILGTPAYMSPEQWEGKPADARSDIFSFGAVLYELLTGKQAFAGDSAASILASVMRDHPTGSVELTGPVEPVLRRCLAKDPDQRFQTASDLKWALQNLSSTKVVAPAEVPFKVSKVAIVERFFLTLFFLLTAALGIAWFTQRPVEIPNLRYELEPPSGTSNFTNPYHANAVSPDGKMLVFGALGSGGNPTLWLRPLDSLEARELPGTEQANAPFFSPDGKSLGFFAAGKLERIELAGGAPQVLCNAPGEQGGAWGSDGTIVFSADNIIQRIAAAGGAPAPVTALDSSRGETGHYFPQLLEDGRTFLYLIESAHEEVKGLYAATLDRGKAGSRILPTSTKSMYAPRSRGNPGELLWMRGETLVAQGFDSDTLRLEGEAVPMAEDVGISNGVGRAAFWVSPKGPLVYRSGGGAALRLSWLGRDGKLLDMVAQGGSESQRLSPDGHRVALQRTVAINSDIWIYEFGRATMTRLTFDPAEENDPVWSPDGRQLAFFSNRSGKFQMYVKDAGGAGAEEQLHQGANAEMPLDWSRDGKYLLYREDNPTTRGDLMILPLEGDRKPVPFSQTPFNEVFGMFSPDGKWIVYTSEETGQPEVYVRASPVAGTGSGASPAGKWQVSNGGGFMPHWRGDGKELFYRFGAAVYAAEIRIVAGRPEIDPPKRLFSVGGPNAFDVAADGQRFLMMVQPESSDRNLKVVSNWRALLKK